MKTPVQAVSVGLVAAIGAAAVISSQGCIFTQWTDRYFVGSTGEEPVLDNRLVAGLHILPFAIVGDIISFPIQGLILAFMGDDVPYSRMTRAEWQARKQSKEAAQAFRGVTPEQRQQFWAEVDRRLRQIETPVQRRAMAFGIGAGGEVVELELDDHHLSLLMDRALTSDTLTASLDRPAAGE